jgi:single-stranded-DNA-specific exonuclease
MTVGIQCLLEDQPEAALRLAQTLDQLNRERRAIEAGAQEAALAQAEDMIASQSDPAQGMFSLALFRADWHPGIVGLIAGRLKERFYRPAIVFALDPQNPEQLKGSGRSIPGVHLRDILERIDTLHPGLIAAFGGHAMAAGLTIKAADLPRFKTLFEATTSDFADPSDLRQLLTLDGPLEPDFLRLDVADLIEQQIWGQGFPAPIFSNDFIVHRSRRLKEKHLKLELSLAAQAGAASARLDAIWFNAPQDLPPRARLAYRLATNEWQGLRQVQLEIVSAL